jgi:hypothetical protein
LDAQERKEDAECAMTRDRQLSTCVTDVAKCEKGRQKGDKMDERDMEEEGKEREGKGWEDSNEKGHFWKMFAWSSFHGIFLILKGE